MWTAESLAPERAGQRGETQDGSNNPSLLSATNNAPIWAFYG